MKLALETDSLDAIADRIRILLKPETPTELDGQAEDAAHAGRGRQLLSQGNRRQRTLPASRSSIAAWRRRKDRPHQAPRPQDLAAGRRPASSRCPASSRAIPKSGKRNVGMYRMQVYDGQTTGMHWQRQKVAAEHMRDRLRAASPTPAAAVDLMALTAGGTTAAASLDTIPTATLDQDSRRPHGGRRRHRHRSGDDLQRHRSCAARRRGVPDRRLPAPEARRTGQGRDRRSRGPRPRRVHPRRLRRARRAAHRRPLRRPHRLLHHAGRLPGLPRHLHHASQRPHLRRHHRRQAAHGGRLDGQGRRAHLPAAHATHAAGDSST